MSYVPQKNYLIMRDIVIKHHPEFKKSKDLQEYGLEHPEIFNCERLVEESLAAVGGYNFVDESCRDFDDTDNSDSKTVTVQPSTPYMEVGGVENKIGSLRITIYNPYSESLDYMYVPKDDVKTLKESCYGKNSHKEKLKTRYNSQTNNYNRLEKFRVKSFKDLAKAKD